MRQTSVSSDRGVGGEVDGRVPGAVFRRTLAADQKEAEHCGPQLWFCRPGNYLGDRPNRHAGPAAVLPADFEREHRFTFVHISRPLAQNLTQNRKNRGETNF